MAQYYALKGLVKECVGVLSTLAYMGNKTSDKAAEAFSRGMNRLPGFGLTHTIMKPTECNLSIVQNALDRLILTAPNLKKQILEACVACIVADGKVTVEEGELIRAIGDALDCPIPPFVQGQS